MKVISKDIGCGKTTELVKAAYKYATENNTTAVIVGVMNQVYSVLEGLGIKFHLEGSNQLKLDEFERAFIVVESVMGLSNTPMKVCLFVDDYDLIKEDALRGRIAQIHTLTVTPTKKEF